MGLIIVLVFLGVFAVVALLLAALGTRAAQQAKRVTKRSTRPWPQTARRLVNKSAAFARSIG